MSFYSINQLPEEKKDEALHLSNTSAEDFETTYLNDKNESIPVIIPALKSEIFPHNVGLIIRNHLATFILNQSDFDYKTDVTIELERIKKEVTIDG